MQKTVWLGVMWILGAVAINACKVAEGTAGASEGAGDTGTGGAYTTSPPSGTGGKATTSSSSSSSSASSSSGGTTINGCELATAEDHTTDASVTIEFGGTHGNTYAPACIKIAQGTSVTFSGAFTTHPLQGGNAGTPDATSPITSTTTGTTASFTFADAGSFPYYCTAHFGSGMQGAVFVE
ncbi:Halocyanin [Minicystis rosea]|nr:Halocyanin [Minicystis rosea]